MSIWKPVTYTENVENNSSVLCSVKAGIISNYNGDKGNINGQIYLRIGLIN